MSQRLRLTRSCITQIMAPKTGNTETSAGSRNLDSGAKSASNPRLAKARPTHFLSLPIGHHPELRKLVHEFHEKVLPTRVTSSDIVTIEGLDKSILVDPRRLHFTIGVLTLPADSPQQDVSSAYKSRTLSDAIALLRSLGPEISEITRQPILLSLDKMGVLKTKRQEAGVLYVGPGDEKDETTVKLCRILDLVGQRFRREGFIEESPRPSVLHCTLINASHRKPRRIPRSFSYREIFDRASVVQRLPVEQTDSSNANRSLSPPGVGREVRVDFGTWAVSEIQLCEMGSHGPENEYVSCASVSFGAV